jgi:hypothetical protein
MGSGPFIAHAYRAGHEDYLSTKCSRLKEFILFIVRGNESKGKTNKMTIGDIPPRRLKMVFRGCVTRSFGLRDPKKTGPHAHGAISRCEIPAE